jgi:membrane associated rhomboid family serine protease
VAEGVFQTAATSVVANRDALGKHLSNVKSGVSECIEDLGSEVFYVVSFASGPSASADDVGDFISGAYTQVSQHLKQWRDLLLPGYFSEAVLLKITIVECACYAFEVFYQPDIGWPCWLHQLGAGYGPALTAGGEWWRLVTPIFLHGNLSHLFMNCFIQVRLGFRVERILGASKFALLYFGSGILANLVSFSWDPIKLAVGASTSVFGVVGAGFALYLIRWPHLPTNHKIMAVTYGMLIATLLYATPINIDAIGHGVGFVAGAAIMLLLTPDEHWHDRNHRLVFQNVAKTALWGCIVASVWGWHHMPDYDYPKMLADSGVCQTIIRPGRLFTVSLPGC